MPPNPPREPHSCKVSNGAHPSEQDRRQLAREENDWNTAQIVCGEPEDLAS